MDWKKIFLSTTLVIGIIGGPISFATGIKDIPRVAVMNFGNKAITSEGLRDTDMSSATEYAIYQLSASGWFDLIDYEQLSTVAKMHKINMTGLVDPSTTVAMGKFLGAEYMVIGYVTGLTVKESEASVQWDRAKAGNAKHNVTANVMVRIVDIATGRIVAAGIGKGSSASTSTEISYQKYRNKKYRNTTADSILGSIGTGENYIPSESETNEDSTLDTTTDTTTNTDTGNGILETVPNVGNDISLYGGGDYTDEDAANTDDTSTGDSGDYIENGNDGTYDSPVTGGYDDSSDSSGSDNDTDTTGYDYQETKDYRITIGSTTVSDVQVRNAISKAVKDAIYGNMGLLTTLNDGKKLKIKTGV